MKLSVIFLFVFLFVNVNAREYHVAKNGNDSNPGTKEMPLLSIQAAAELAQPGDVITVHKGVYREKIVPARGGTSDDARITYRAAKGEEVHIKGSEIIEDWEKYQGTVWKVSIPNSFFKDYNPYKELIEGDWFNDHKRKHHTGEVYLNGKSFWEAPKLEEVLDGKPNKNAFDSEGSKYLWYCESDENNTVLYANFHDFNPNNEQVEINVRNTCFYPAQTGINYITIQGFHLSQSATNWAAPTAEQIGLIGTFWSKGWIIEDNVISDSKCSGITLGKDRKSGHNAWSKERTKGGATIYNEVILRVIKDGWGKEKIGSHIVRNNEIFNCEQTGMCGSFGAAFCQVYGNHIYNIWRKRQFSGAEIGAIKFHGAIDGIIRNNCLHDAYRAIWLDWMTQGTRVSSNVCFNNDFADLFIEVNHGPYLVDNNILLSGIQNWSQGGAFVHNIIAGKVMLHPVPNRYTPYHYAHTTELMGFGNIRCGDDHFFNNIFLKSDYTLQNSYARHQGYGLKAYNDIENALPVRAKNNVYYKGAEAYEKEQSGATIENHTPAIRMLQEKNAFYLELDLGNSIAQQKAELVGTETLGKALMTHTLFENRNGTPLEIDKDYFGKQRSAKPMVGPFEGLEPGQIKLKVWEK